MKTTIKTAYKTYYIDNIISIKHTGRPKDNSILVTFIKPLMLQEKLGIWQEEPNNRQEVKRSYSLVESIELEIINNESK